MDNCVVFDASLHQQHIDQCTDPLVIDVSELEIIDTTKGARLVPAGSEADTPVFMLVPREEVVGSGKQVDVSSLIAALETLESNNKVSLEHGKSRYVGHASSGTKYTCSGVVPNHGGKGIRESSLKDLPEAQWKGLIKFVRKCEHLLIGYLDSGVLQGFQNAMRFGNFATMPGPPGTHKNASIYGAISSGRNVFLSSHMDEDFFYSVVTVQAEKSDGSLYLMSDDICYYFVFTEYGVAVALRPGDVLLFNPLAYHSVMTPVNPENEVWCCSLYLKMGVVGKNDNSMPLTELEKEWLRNEQVCC